MHIVLSDRIQVTAAKAPLPKRLCTPVNSTAGLNSMQLYSCCMTWCHLPGIAVDDSHDKRAHAECVLANVECDFASLFRPQASIEVAAFYRTHKLAGMDL